MLARTKIVKFLGGLGNQMFQYAFFLSLEKCYGKVKADLTGFGEYRLHHGFELAKVFGVAMEQATPFELRIYTSQQRDWLTRKLRRIYGTKGAEYDEQEEFAFDTGIYEDASPRHRSEEHTSELQSRENLVCRLLLEKKKKKPYTLRTEK